MAILRSIPVWFLVYIPLSLFVPGALWTILMLSFFAIMLGPRTRWLHSLPIPRRYLLWLTIFPVVLAILALGSLNALAYAHPRAIDWLPVIARAPRLTRGGHWSQGNTPDIQVPLEFWSVTRAAAPVIKSPWGETSTPSAASLLGITVYNPYSVGRKNTPAFLEWQLNRAARTVYARTIPAVELADILSSRRFPEHWSPIAHSPRRQILATAILLAVALVWQFLIGCPQWRRVNRYKAGDPQSPWNVAIIFGLLTVVIADSYIGAHLGGAFTQPFDALVNAAANSLSQALPAGMSSVIAAAAVLMAIPYWALQKQFSEREVPTQIVKPAWGSLW
jgi:hypothetical protein